jgi:hypothetical protein
MGVPLTVELFTTSSALPLFRLVILMTPAGTVPVAAVLTPVNATVDVVALPPVPNVKTKLAVLLPADPGVNTTCTVQVALTARLAPQLFVSEKSLEFVPEIVIEVIGSGLPPEFVRVIVCAEAVEPGVVLGKLRLVVLNEPVPAAGATPVPLKLIVCVTGVSVIASAVVTLSVAVSIPVEDGWNRTEMVQPAAAANVAPQLFTKLKSEAFAPVMVTEPMLTEPVPELVMVSVCSELTEPAMTLPKLIGVVLTVAVPVPTPVPLRAMVETTGVCVVASAVVTVKVADSGAMLDGWNVIESEH